MSLSQDYATRMREVADTFASLDVDRRDPARYHERKDEAVKDLRKLADAVEIDQVFVDRPGLASLERPATGKGPRTIVVKGRPVKVESRRRASRAA